MTAQERRSAVARALHASASPVSAGALAEQFSVSRQVIVGDIALLRAGGEGISATPRGYVIRSETDLLIRSVACTHSAAQTEQELCIMVDNGCTVRDVIVEHPVYGQLVGTLDLHSRYDVRQFLERSAAAAPLSSLTDGIHLHTLLCPDEAAFERVRAELSAAGLLFSE